MFKALILLPREKLIEMLKDKGFRSSLTEEEMSIMESQIATLTPRRGRPQKPAAQRMQTRIIQMPDELWDYCLEQDGCAAPDLRRLVQEDRDQRDKKMVRHG